jgi:transcriptional regulator with XRE-family HTH domain
MAKTHGGSRRTSVPSIHLQLLGEKIRSALNMEHIQWQQKQGVKKKFNTIRFCDKTRIPYDTINAYMEGKRLPGVVDLREIAAFCGITMEELMTPIPSNVELNRLWEEHRKKVHQEKAALTEVDEEEDTPESRYRRQHERTTAADTRQTIEPDWGGILGERRSGSDEASEQED